MARRFFQTSNASRRYRAGGLSLSFELTENVGGTWRGVLATDDESVASTLLAAGHPQIQEITQEQYEAQKKTLHGTGFSSFKALPQPPPPPPAPKVALVAGGNTLVAEDISDVPPFPAPKSDDAGVELEIRALPRTALRDELAMSGDSARPQ